MTIRYFLTKCPSYEKEYPSLTCRPGFDDNPAGYRIPRAGYVLIVFIYYPQPLGAYQQSMTLLQRKSRLNIRRLFYLIALLLVGAVEGSIREHDTVAGGVSLVI